MRSIAPTLLVLSVVCSVLLLPADGLGQAKTVELIRRILDLPAPPPSKLNDANIPQAVERPPEFYSWKNIPPDDAPIEDLFEFWRQPYGDGNTLAPYQIPPSPKTLERLLDHCRDYPSRITEILGRVPRNEQAVEGIKEIYEKLRRDKTDAEYARGSVKQWLTHNSPMFTDDLARTASRIKDEDDYVSNESQIALRALARVDWNAALPHIDRLEYGSGQPFSQILAYWVRYQHAVATDDASSIDIYRDKLKKIVEDKNTPWKQRDLALDALVAEGPWDGRDEWYTSLFADETMLEIQDNGHTGLTTMMRAVEPGSWRERLIKMLSSPQKAIRSAAVRNLIEGGGFDEEIVEALLPWLSDPNWAKQSRRDERGSLIDALGKVDIPQAVPLLISVLTSEEKYMAIAAKALAEKKDERAIPALRSALSHPSGRGRSEIIAALAASGGFTDYEQLGGLEAYLKMTLTEEGREKFHELKYEAETEYGEEYDEEGEAEEPNLPAPSKAGKKEPQKLPLEVSIGEYVAKLTDPGEGLAAMAIAREKELRKKNSEIAANFANVINGWKGRAIYLEWLRRLRSDDADIDTVLEILAARKDILEKLPIETALLRSSPGSLRGVAACIIEDEQDLLSIIATGDAESKTAMLACGRLLRLKLPVDGVANLLSAKSAAVRHGAERYLETEDSVAARTILIKHRPGQASILGARLAFVPDSVRSAYRSESLAKVFDSVNRTMFWTEYPLLKKFEDRLRAELKEDPNLISIYAHLVEWEAGNQVIRVYKDKVRFTVYEDPARYREGELTEKEFKEFYNFVLSERIDEVGPVVQSCHHGCPSGEFVMFSRDGGRRNFYYAYQPPEKLGKLSEFYEAFTKKDLKLKYALADSIKGLEIILANDMFPVHAVWKQDGDLRFLVSDREMRTRLDADHAEQSRQERDAAAENDAPEYADLYEMQRKRKEAAEGVEFSWRTLEKGKIGPETTKPDVFTFDVKQSKLMFESNSIQHTGAVAGESSPSLVVFAHPYQPGLFRLKEGEEEPVKIKDGVYSHPVVTADGKWAIASKFESKGSSLATLIRINLASGQETRISLPPADGLYPVRFLAGRKKVLVYRGPARVDRYGARIAAEAQEETEVSEVPTSLGANPTPKVPEYFLLDAATGSTESVRGVFAPLEESGYRPLQRSASGDSSWVVLYDERSRTSRIGLYSESRFTFESVVVLPGIRLSSMNIWVDEKENKAYFTYNGHLLAVPFRI